MTIIEWRIVIKLFYMMKELVSVIIPVWNRPDLLCQAVFSVIAQTYRPIEIIIIDDGSTDNTLEVAKDLSRQYSESIIVIRQNKSMGPGLSREQGRRIAKGEFIQYLDSDDLLLPGKFEMQVEGLRKFPVCGVSYGKTVYTEKNEIYIEKPWKRTGEQIETMFPSFLQDRWWGTSTPLYRKSICDAAGPWKNISNEQDWEYDCRVAALGTKLHYCDEFVSHERAHGGIRQCDDTANDPVKLAGRAKARLSIWQSAVKAGISRERPEAQHFSRYAFLLARQCGLAGLSSESKMLFELARMASTSDRARGLDFVLFKVSATIIGWPATAKLSRLFEQLR